MTLTETKKAFAALGTFLSQFTSENALPQPGIAFNDDFFEKYSNLIQQAQVFNHWFVPDQVLFATQQWAAALTEENLDNWTNRYELGNVMPKTVAIIMAGNIPLVGFHDFLSVLIAGHNVLAKLSGNDKHLLPLIADYLIALNPDFKNRITFTEGKLEHFDAVIATGSNNTARYFEYYFKDKPNIIRKNRNSVAVLTGNESKEELEALGEDIFRYFGLGCRNVSKLFVPEGYDFKDFFEAMYTQHEVIHFEKYINNYDYNKAVFLMSNFQLLDNGFLTLKEDSSYASPISSIFYEYYSDIECLKAKFSEEHEQLQCIVAATGFNNAVKFGHTQKPTLLDYADNVDTISFLSKIS